MSKKNKKPSPYLANPEFSKAMHGLRSSSAAQRHTPRPRKGTRAQKQTQAIRDQKKE